VVVTAKPASTSTNGVVRVGLLSMLGLVALGLTRVIHGSLISYFTDKATVGFVGMLVGVGMTAGLFLPGGLASAASKFIPFHRGKGDHDTAEHIYTRLRWTGIACALGLGVVVGLGTAVLLDLSVGNTVAVSLFTAVFSVYSIEKGALYGFDRVASYARLEIAGSVLAVLLTLVVVLTGLRTFLAPLIIGYSVLIIGAWFILRRHANQANQTNQAIPAVPANQAGEARADRAGAATQLSRTHRHEITEFVLLASAGSLASAGLLQLLPLLAHFFTNPSEVAYFATSVTLVAPLYFLPRALGMALFPAMAHAHGAGDTDAVRRHADLSTRALLVLLAPVFAAAILVAGDAMQLFFGSDFAAGAPVLQLLLVATYLAVIQVAAVNALSSGTRREVRIPVTSAVAGSALGLVALVPLGLWLGSAGVGLAYLIAVGAGAAGSIVAAWRRYDMAWASPLVRSLAVVVVALAIGLAVDALGPAGVAGILLDIGLAVVVAVAAAALLRPDITAIVRLARRR
jgi:O-antigen/teichoic acid export membrane protein